MKLIISQQNLTRATAGFLAAWLSGLALLFCCVSMPRVSAMETADISLPAKADHCKKSKEQAETSDFAAFQPETKSLSCCAFLPKLLDRTRNFEKNSQPSVAAKIEEPGAPKFSYAVQTVPPQKNFSSAIRDRGGTYLKNCVFRI